jgi:hypothetical protein
MDLFLHKVLINFEEKQLLERKGFEDITASIIKVKEQTVQISSIQNLLTLLI